MLPRHFIFGVMPLVRVATPLTFSGSQAPLGQQCIDLASTIETFAPPLAQFENLYKDIHQHPELSCSEARTSSIIADRLQDLGFDVRQSIGGHGVVGVLQNGPGKVVMLRAELDALPIQEQTGLSFSSTKRMADMWGRDQPVMHACGHDMHMACLIAAAKLLHDARSAWAGTLEVLFQPNEEHTGGAQSMINDGLYEKIPKPDVVMAQHLMQIPSGTLSIKSGPVLVSADTVKLRVFSSEGHAANPQVSVEISVVVSKIVLRLQDLVKEVSKDGYASIHVEELHIGAPGLDWVEYADVVLDVKAYDPSLRSRLLDGINGIVEDESTASGAAKKPCITSSVRAPLTNNDGHLAGRVGQVFADFFGADKVLQELPSHPCEDFSILARAVQSPYVFWFLGRVHPEDLERARRDGNVLDKIPIEHSAFNAPLIHPTLETGMKALSVAALSFLTEDNTC
ncbi:uncharacterized protein TrAFT101_004430 [Trichoderma asperellum]|uniref:uncharacterized protein n=1 Tax=Trichoderma asperellum TaxID=101201 RepID=UPI003332547E|nr:hypothetical protein TrAFT101_004430 [Trichoderma asperellum]